MYWIFWSSSFIGFSPTHIIRHNIKWRVKSQWIEKFSILALADGRLFTARTYDKQSCIYTFFTLCIGCDVSSLELYRRQVFYWIDIWNDDIFTSIFIASTRKWINYYYRYLLLFLHIWNIIRWDDGQRTRWKKVSPEIMYIRDFSFAYLRLTLHIYMYIYILNIILSSENLVFFILYRYHYLFIYLFRCSFLPYFLTILKYMRRQ